MAWCASRAREIRHNRLGDFLVECIRSTAAVATSEQAMPFPRDSQPAAREACFTLYTRLTYTSRNQMARTFGWTLRLAWPNQIAACPRIEIFCSATDVFKNWGVICNTLICCEFPHFMPQMTPNFCELAPAQSIPQKIIRLFCLRVDPNPQSQQRGRSFLCMTMFPGWHAKEYLCRFSEQQISRTNCAQTVISKFPKALR